MLEGLKFIFSSLWIGHGTVILDVGVGAAVGTVLLTARDLSQKA